MEQYSNQPSFTYQELCEQVGFLFLQNQLKDKTIRELQESIKKLEQSQVFVEQANIRAKMEAGLATA